MKFAKLTTIASAALFGATLAAGQLTPAVAQSLKAETGSAPSCPYQIMVLNAKYAKKLGVDIQVNDGKTLTKSMMLVGQGKLEMTSAVPAPYEFMKTGAAMYKTLGKDKSSALAKNLRGMFGYDCGYFLPIVWDNSPIKTWEDLKGKKVFTGPPSGAAALDMEQFIEAMTGYKPNVDYKAVRLNWGGAQPAMRDGQLDVYMRPMLAPSALIDELVAIRPVRFLEVTPADIKKPGMQKLITKAGNHLTTLKAGAYKGVVNNDHDMPLPGLGLIQVVGAQIPDDVVYKMTKAMFDNIDEIHKNNPAFASFGLNNPFGVLNVPLHPGAYKYYKEHGVKVPANLMPPGMK